MLDFLDLGLQAPTQPGPENQIQVFFKSSTCSFLTTETSVLPHGNGLFTRDSKIRHSMRKGLKILLSFWGDLTAQPKV